MGLEKGAGSVVREWSRGSFNLRTLKKVGERLRNNVIFKI